MRAALTFLLLIASAPTLAATPVSFSAFDESIASTKQLMMANPDQALASALGAVAIAHLLPPSRRTEVAAIEAEWLHGEALLYLNRLADAAPIVETALKQAAQIAPNTKLYGDLLRSHGAIAAGNGDNGQALRDYQRAHDVFRAAKVDRSQAFSLQDIGLLYFDAGDYQRALNYFDQSAEVLKGDATLTLTMHNNRAEVFRKQGRYAEAATAYRMALIEARKLDSPLLQVRILTNLAGALAEAHRLVSAQLAVDQAMALARRGEASGWRPFAYGVAARIAFERGDTASAEQLIKQTFAGVDLNSSEMLFREYHQTASQIYEARGDEAQALAHLKAFQRLDSEAQALTASAASQLLAARFDFSNQNLKIAHLKQGQLQRDIAMERQKNRFRTILLGGVAAAGALITALLLVGFLSIRRSRNRTRDANTTLSQVNGALETALKAKTEFLATTSHEIRTPLNGILGMTQVLLADRRVVHDIRERIEVVHGAGETMRALVDDILDVAKIESGKLTVIEEEVDLRELLRDVARLWSGEAESKGLTLRVAIDDAPARIVSDASRLRQIVFNLLSNALKFTSAGEVALRVCSEGDNRLIIAISDTGIGIPAEHLDAIFDAFRQVDSGVTRQFGGTGLGLAICRNIARAMGGDVTVESVIGEGTNFTVILPLRLATEVASAPVTACNGASGLAGKSVLIIERDPMAQSVLRMLLATEDATTDVVADCSAALAALEGGEFDHLLIDAGAVDAEDRLNALRDIAAAARRTGASCTLTVASGSDFSIAEAMTVGATQIVVKPVPADQLIAAMAGPYGDKPELLIAPSLFERDAA